MILSLTGRDRVKFLHNLCTNDIYRLATGRDGQSFGKRPKDDFTVTPSGRSCLAAALTRQGKMVAVFRVWMLADELLLDTDEPALEAHLRAAIIMDKVEVAFSTRWRSAYVAPADHVPPMTKRGVTVESVPPLADGFAVLHDDDLIEPMAPDVYATSCVLGGWPRWGIEMDSSMLPTEAGLDPIAISYTKGCYLGQEVIQRVKTYSQPPRELKQLHFDEGAPLPSSIQAGGETVGDLKSSYGRFALALMKKSHAKDGTRVDAAVVRDLPWHQWI